MLFVLTLTIVAVVQPVVGEQQEMQSHASSFVSLLRPASAFYNATNQVAPLQTPEMPSDVLAEVSPVFDRYSHFYHLPDKYIHTFARFPQPAKKIEAWVVVYIPAAVAFEIPKRYRLLNGSLLLKGQSYPRRAPLRRLFQRSWAFQHGHAKLHFVFSKVSPFLQTRPDLRRAMEEEQTKYNDFVFVDCLDVDEDYAPPSPTTIKAAYALLHANTYYSFNWFVRGADDTFFNVDQFLRTVMILKKEDKLPRHRVAMGLLTPRNPTRTRFNRARYGHFFPPYFDGMGYILSFDLAETLAKLIEHSEAPLNVDWPEDAVVSSWLLPFGVHYVDSPRWFHEKNPKKHPVRYRDGCPPDTIMTHHLAPSDFLKIEQDGYWKCN